MDPRVAEFLLRFAGLDKIDIPIRVMDKSIGGRLKRGFNSGLGPVKGWLNQKASIPKLLTPKSDVMPSPWGGSLSGTKPVVNTLGGEVVDVASSTPKSLLSRVKSVPGDFKNRLAGVKVPNVFGAAKDVKMPRIAGKVKGFLPKGSAAPLNIALTGLEMKSNLDQGMNPVDAFGRPLFQLGGSILGGAGAGTLGLPSGPGAFVTGLAGMGVGWEGGGLAWDALRSGPGDPITGGVLGGPLPKKSLRFPYIDNSVAVGIPVTEGLGTKLIRTEDGGVIRVPIDAVNEGSTVISQDGVLEPSVSSGEGVTVADQVTDFLSELGERDKWEQKTQNSPARSSGAFTDDELWELQKKHREWKANR